MSSLPAAGDVVIIEEPIEAYRSEDLGGGGFRRVTNQVTRLRPGHVFDVVSVGVNSAWLKGQHYGTLYEVHEDEFHLSGGGARAYPPGTKGYPPGSDAWDYERTKWCAGLAGDEFEDEAWPGIALYWIDGIAEDASYDVEEEDGYDYRSAWLDLAYSSVQPGATLTDTSGDEWEVESTWGPTYETDCSICGAGIDADDTENIVQSMGLDWGDDCPMCEDVLDPNNDGTLGCGTASHWVIFKRLRGAQFEGLPDWYFVSKTYEVWTEADVDAGEPGETGYDHEDTEMDLEDLLGEFDRNTWEPSNNGRDWRTVDDDIDVQTGARTSYGLHVRAQDADGEERVLTDEEYARLEALQSGAMGREGLDDYIERVQERMPDEVAEDVVDELLPEAPGMGVEVEPPPLAPAPDYTEAAALEWAQWQLGGPVPTEYARYVELLEEDAQLSGDWSEWQRFQEAQSNYKNELAKQQQAPPLIQTAPAAPLARDDFDDDYTAPLMPGQWRPASRRTGAAKTEVITDSAAARVGRVHTITKDGEEWRLSVMGGQSAVGWYHCDPRDSLADLDDYTEVEMGLIGRGRLSVADDIGLPQYDKFHETGRPGGVFAYVPIATAQQFEADFLALDDDAAGTQTGAQAVSQYDATSFRDCPMCKVFPNHAREHADWRELQKNAALGGCGVVGEKGLNRRSGEAQGPISLQVIETRAPGDQVAVLTNQEADLDDVEQAQEAWGIDGEVTEAGGVTIIQGPPGWRIELSTPGTSGMDVAAAHIATTGAGLRHIHRAASLLVERNPPDVRLSEADRRVSGVLTWETAGARRVLAHCALPEALRFGVDVNRRRGRALYSPPVLGPAGAGRFVFRT